MPRNDAERQALLDRYGMSLDGSKSGNGGVFDGGRTQSSLGSGSYGADGNFIPSSGTWHSDGSFTNSGSSIAPKASTQPITDIMPMQNNTLFSNQPQFDPQILMQQMQQQWQQQMQQMMQQQQQWQQQQQQWQQQMQAEELRRKQQQKYQNAYGKGVNMQGATFGSTNDTQNTNQGGIRPTAQIQQVDGKSQAISRYLAKDMWANKAQ